MLKIQKTKIMEIKNETGQASIESLIASSALILFFTFFICLIYLGGAYGFIRYASHEYLLCPEYQQKYLCVKSFENTLKQIIRFGEIQNFKSQESGSQRNVSFLLSLKILNISKLELNYRDQIQLPLRVE